MTISQLLSRIKHLSAWSVDSLANQFPSWPPYVAFNDNPILYVDPDGRKVKASNGQGLDAINSTKKHWNGHISEGN